MFGPGMYFAETEQICQYKARKKGTCIKANVFLGKSLILTKATPNMCYATLRENYKCDSVKGDKCVSNPEYVVYNSFQIRDIEIVSGNNNICLNNKCM